MIYRKKFSYFGWREEQAIENSVARFGKILSVFGKLSALCVGQNFERILPYLLYFWATPNCCKLPNIKK